MGERGKVSVLALALLGIGVLAVCGGRSAAEPVTQELTSLAGGWKALANFDSNGKLQACMALRLPDKDGAMFGVFAAPAGMVPAAIARPDGNVWGVVVRLDSWQLELGDKPRPVDVTFDAQAQRHVSAYVEDKQTLLIPTQDEEMAGQFRKAYAISMVFEGRRFNFSLAGTFRLLPVLTNCIQTSSISKPDKAPAGLHAFDVTPQGQTEKDCFQKANADLKIAACSQLLARGGRLDAHRRFAYYFNRSKAYNVKKQYDSALADLDAASVLDPENTGVFYGRGEVYRHKGELDRALTNYNASILRSPRSTLDHIGRGQTYLRKGDLDHALSDFNNAIRINPTKSSEAYSGRGEVYSRQGDYDRALAEYDSAIRLDPSDSDAYVDRAEVHERRGDYENAIKDAGRAIRLDPKWAHPHSVLGRVYYLQGNYDRALSECDEAIRLDPSGSDAYGGRAEVHARRGDHEMAIRDAEQAIRLDPKWPYPHAVLAYTFAKKGDFGRAQSEIDDAFRLDSKSAGAFLHRGDIYLLRKEPQLALKDFEDALALNPHSMLAKAGRDAARLALAAPIAPPSTAAAPAPAVAAVAPPPTRTPEAQPVAMRPDASSDSSTFYGEENIDFRVLPQNTLQGVVRKETPLAIPGAATVTTMELKKAMDAGQQMVLIDVLRDEHATTIKGAVPLPYAGTFGTFQDQVQTRLASALGGLLQERTDASLVFFCTGVKCWESYNASLRARAAGFKNVLWYRGGIAAWKEAGFPTQPNP